MFPRHRARHPVLPPGVKRANGHGCAHPGLGGAVFWSQREPGTGTAPDPIHPHEESPFIGVLHSLPDSHLWGSYIHSGEPVYRDPTPEPTGSGTAAAPGRALSPSTNDKVLQLLGGATVLIMISIFNIKRSSSIVQSITLTVCRQGSKSHFPRGYQRIVS